MKPDTKLNYLEFATLDINASKCFFTQVFNWYFTDYGDSYAAFFAGEAGLDGGFFALDPGQQYSPGSHVLPVFYRADLTETQQKVIQAGGVITRPVFTFPGGRRFHFREPGGNELAVWSECLE